MLSRYRTFSLSSVRIITLPDDRHLRRVGVRQYRAHTLRRQMLASFLRASTASGAWAVVARRDASMGSLAIAAWAEELEHVLGEQVQVTAITWSRHAGRRAYVHLETTDQPRALFAKVDLREEPYRLLAEQRALGEPWAEAPFRVPTMVFAGRLAGWMSIVMDGIGPNYRPVALPPPLTAAHVLRSIAGPTRQGLPTFPRYEDVHKDGTLRELLQRDPFLASYLEKQSPVTLGRIHGDFTPANILIEGPDVIVVDWECCTTGAAIATDHVSYLMATDRRLTLADLVRDAGSPSLPFGRDDLRTALVTMACLGQDDRVSQLLSRR